MSEPVPDTRPRFSACHIKCTEGKGRGVYASCTIPAQTIVETSPILYFSKEEYEAHEKYTILDHHHTFKCRDGRMALPLGLGSSFNHSDTPNVSYTIDTSLDCIRYTTTRLIESGEELCIFYGHNHLWFVPDGASSRLQVHDEIIAETADLSMIETLADDDANVRHASLEGGPSDIIPEQDLPFTRIKLLPEEEEEDMNAIRSIQAWVVDLPEPRLTTTLLQWIKRTNLGAPELEHLKRVRRQDQTSTLLLCTSASPPELPSDIDLPEPYMLPVPRTAAFTPNSLRLKSLLWPTLFTPRRKAEPESWSKGKLAWAWDAVIKLLREALTAQSQGELPIVAHIRTQHDDQDESHLSFTAHDTRKSTGHPLRHAVMNVIRRISDYRTLESASVSLSPPLQSNSGAEPLQQRMNRGDNSRNRSNYLLTSMTLFITHEPCIMCSMALLHSRVKEVIYLIPMEKTGGCGSLACIPRLDGVNHRFGICRWNLEKIDVGAFEIDPHMDA